MPLTTGFCHKSQSGEDKAVVMVEVVRRGSMWRKEATLSKCRNQGQDKEVNLIQILKHTTSPTVYLINLTYSTVLCSLHFDQEKTDSVCTYGKGSPIFSCTKWESENRLVLCVEDFIYRASG